MSLVLLAHTCSHLQNASRARLGLTSIPCTTMLHTLLLSLQRSGYVSTVAISGPEPPAPSALNPTFSQLQIGKRNSAWSEYPQHVSKGMLEELREGSTVPKFATTTTGDGVEEGVEQEIEEEEIEEEVEAPAITRANISTRRLWVGLKYWNNEPVLRGMSLVSKPTRRVWMGVPDLMELTRGNQRGYVKGLRGVGESMYVTTDRGIMEIRECVERRAGGMLLCRVNPF